jgi:hypothetical protein
VDSLPPWAFLPYVEVRALSYMNLGLILNIGRITDERGRHNLVPLNGWYEKSVIGAMNPRRAHNLFLHYHADEIKRETQFGRHHLNLFAHPLLGGLGFTIPKGVVPSYSEPQRHLAARLLAVARADYSGTSREHPLKAFVHLSAPERVSTSLGTLGFDRPIHTRLTSPVGPFLENEELLDLDFQIKSTALATKFELPDKVSLKPNSRLSSSELNRLLKSANHHRLELLPVKDMHLFPFRIVSYDPALEIARSEPVVPPPSLSKPISVYELDEPLEEIFEEDFSDSGEESPIVSFREEEDTSWEDHVPPSPILTSALAEYVASRPKRSTITQRKALYSLNFSQGLLDEASAPKRRVYSRKGGKKW